MAGDEPLTLQRPRGSGSNSGADWSKLRAKYPGSPLVLTVSPTALRTSRGGVEVGVGEKQLSGYVTFYA